MESEKSSEASSVYSLSRKLSSWRLRKRPSTGISNLSTGNKLKDISNVFFNRNRIEVNQEKVNQDKENLSSSEHIESDFENKYSYDQESSDNDLSTLKPLDLNDAPETIVSASSTSSTESQLSLLSKALSRIKCEGISDTLDYRHCSVQRMTRVPFQGVNELLNKDKGSRRTSKNHIRAQRRSWDRKSNKGTKNDYEMDADYIPKILMSQLKQRLQTIRESQRKEVDGPSTGSIGRLFRNYFS
ncbi:Piso0_004891 [Millerozyma farinosa CBS 7064]|uniref:Piso0_004891 protein n=1 Tax=Pichia sorbitophila (strain ATCC MYA-4447 / BCRC 22081 / CBS 7064 / NBRC 10061 / NRRL Y-12695) TaxID=559304 RepID=G8Y3N7_PICSO|nr:Piso0_004891 [Millerozyma farinosa CBS 7064]